MSLSVGVELSPSAVRVAIAQRLGGQTKTLALHGAPCETANLEALTRTLSQLRRSIPITQPVILGLPSTSTILATVTPLVVNAQRAELAVQFELQQQLPFELAAAVWHYRWLASTNGHPGAGRSRRSAQAAAPSPEAVVVAMKRSLFDERLSCCRRAGLSVRAVTPSAVAVLNAWSAAQPRPPGPRESVALIRLLGDQSAEWIVWTSSGLQIVPISSPSPQALAQDAAALWSSLAGQLPQPASIVWVTGSSAARTPLQEALRAHGTLEVRSFDVAQAAGAAAARAEELDQAAGALGLALQGLGPVRVSLNLLERLQLDDRARLVARSTAVASGLLAVMAIGVGLSGMLEVRQRRVQILTSLERRERLYQSLRPEIRAMLQRQQHTQRRMRQLERLGLEADALTDLLAQVAAVLPDSVWLTKLESVKPVPVAGAREAAAGSVAEALLEGRAKAFQDVTQLLDRLKAIPGVASVKPLSTSVVPDGGGGGKEEVVFAVQVQRAGRR